MLQHFLSRIFLQRIAETKQLLVKNILTLVRAIASTQACVSLAGFSRSQILNDKTVKNIFDMKIDSDKKHEKIHSKIIFTYAKYLATTAKLVNV